MSRGRPARRQGGPTCPVDRAAAPSPKAVDVGHIYVHQGRYARRSDEASAEQARQERHTQQGIPRQDARDQERLLKVANPRARLSHTEKKGKIFSALGEFLWYLAKSNDLNFISYYIGQYLDESEDGATVYGAYGPRLYGLRGNNQVEHILDLLTRNPGSRRAVIQLFDADDIREHHREIPCTCTLQFMVRDGQVELATTMRSNDAFKGLPHDVFSFTMIQEMVARILGLEPGVYTHFVGSLHLYNDGENDNDDVPAARQYLDEGWQPTQLVEMPAMPTGDPRPSIETVARAEAAIREGRDLDDAVSTLPPYWRDIVPPAGDFWPHQERRARRHPGNPSGDGRPCLQGIHHAAGEAGADRAAGGPVQPSFRRNSGGRGRRRGAVAAGNSPIVWHAPCSKCFHIYSDTWILSTLRRPT